jgi:hypothetical protein
MFIAVVNAAAFGIDGFVTAPITLSLSTKYSGIIAGFDANHGGDDGNSDHGKCQTKNIVTEFAVLVHGCT